MQYRVVERFRDQYSIQAMCELLDVSRSAYYAWRRPYMHEQERYINIRICLIVIRPTTVYDLNGFAVKV